VAATLSLAGGITTMITDITISTATTSAFIIFTPAAFTVADFTAVVDFMAAAATGRDELLLIRKDRGSNLEPRSEAALRLPTPNLRISASICGSSFFPSRPFAVRLCVLA
jgi:hypothetical protein